MEPALTASQFRLQQGMLLPADRQADDAVLHIRTTEVNELFAPMNRVFSAQGLGQAGSL
jgi:hypothetical protein